MEMFIPTLRNLLYSIILKTKNGYFNVYLDYLLCGSKEADDITSSPKWLEKQ